MPSFSVSRSEADDLDKAHRLIQMACSEYHISEEELKSGCRKQHVARVRYHVAGLLWEATNLSGQRIAHLLGRRSDYKSVEIYGRREAVI